MPHYLISWGDPHERLFDVSIRFDAPVDAPRLLLPAWRPGRYLLQDYAANVREWGGSHRVRKDGKSSWRVDAHAGEEVEFRYRYYAGVLDAGSSFLDDDEAYFNGSNLFMLVEGLRNEEHGLTIAAPSEWRIETQLPRDAGVFVARDYDQLIDSPVIAAATMTRHSFHESGARFHLIFRGDEGIDTEQYVEPHRIIARVQAELFGGLPFSEYRYLFHVRDKWHGVEHEDSCSIIVRRDAVRGAGPGDEGYDHLLSISSHELFHAWNVKRIVPAVFSPYDYWRETPTRLLWVMEGLTSYYGELTLVRGGIWSEARYLEHLRKEIETLEGLPANRHLSLAQASFDGWLANPAHNHDQSNAWYSFYTKGELVSAMLDLTILRATNGQKSLDDVVRLLWNEHRVLSEDGFERAVAEIADVGSFFSQYVEGTDPLPYAELFGAAGIAFAARRRREPSLAAKLKVADGQLVVESVLRGGAGMAAGLLPGDEILAIDGARVTSEAAVMQALRGRVDGEAMDMLISRAGAVQTLVLHGMQDPRMTFALRANGENELRRRWLRER
jgi:predicted metalloprotease with PDZ domain